MGLCDCDQIESLRITKEYFGGDENEKVFRPRCGDCGGKAKEYPFFEENLIGFPNPDDINEGLLALVNDAFLSDEVDEPGVTVTVTIEDPRSDVDDHIDVIIEWWDNPHDVMNQ